MSFRRLSICFLTPLSDVSSSDRMFLTVSASFWLNPGAFDSRIISDRKFFTVSLEYAMYGVVVGRCSAGDDDDDAAAAAGAAAGGLTAVSANSAAMLGPGRAAAGGGVLLVSLLRVGAGVPSGVGGFGEVRGIESGCISGTGPTVADFAELLRAPRFGAGTMIAGTTGSGCLLRDLDAGLAGGGRDAGLAGSVGGLTRPLLRDLDFDFAFGAAGAGVAGAGVAGGPTGSGCLLRDLAGLADAARLGSALGPAGAGTVLSIATCERFILFIAASLLSLGLISSMPAGGGPPPGGGGGGCTEPFLFFIASALLSLLILAPAAGGGGGGGCHPFAAILSSSFPLCSRDLPRFNFSTFS